ncbi:hypothetical protein ATCC90586_008631 [Pythium insidiosum]|nr:hypothetical protein ATCC90586_008631 [Pythium insidiosum]
MLKMQEDAVEALERQFVRELTSLRDKLTSSNEEKAVLQRRLHQVTQHLNDTTEELDRRVLLYAEATSAVEKLEEQASEASKALLTREMQIHELSQRNSALELRVEALEKERDHWENEYSSAHESQTDLEKLNVDEDMPEMERTELLLKTGLEKQKLSVFESLAKILASNNSKSNLTLILDCIKGRKGMW